MTQVKKSRLLTSFFLFVALGIAQPQTATVSSSPAPVPPLVNFSGVLTDMNGGPPTGFVEVTFSLYKDEQGGAPLWMETQNVQPNRTGHYTVMLGSTTSSGLPSDIFVAGAARWLGVRVQSQEEQPRVLLVAVPYALKAGDAETVGGLPASAFVLAGSVSNSASSANTNNPGTPSTSSGASLSSAPTSSNVTTTGGTVNALPLWTTSTNIQNSVLTQSGTGSTAKLGINTTTPASTLDVKGSGTIRGTLSLPNVGKATSTGGFDSQSIILTASSYNSSLKSAVGQTFQWQAEPTGNNSSSPSGTLNLLFGAGTSKTTETGLKINNSGVFTFATGQTFPGAGTITGVTAGMDLTGGGSSGNVTLNLNTAATDARYAQLGTANTFSGAQTFSGSNSSQIVDVVQGSTGNGIAVTGGTFGVVASGSTFPLVGESSINSEGVYGDSTADSKFVAGIVGQELGSTQETFGVEGYAASHAGAGVYGQVASGSSLGGGYGAIGAGVWGDSSQGMGVLGTSDSWVAVYAANNTAFPTAILTNYSTDSTALLFQTQSMVAVGCTIDTLGNLACAGSKSAVVPVEGGSRKVALYAVEAPENWFEDFGSGQVANGSAVVNLEPTFAQTINTGIAYHVFLTPRGDCEGLYVANATATGFEVRELRHGSSNVAFDYRIVGRRKGYENIRLANMTERFGRPVLPPRLKAGTGSLGRVPLPARPPLPAGGVSSVRLAAAPRR